MKLFPHQVEGLKQTEGRTNCALYWDMGLGKTFGGSEKMVEYGNRVNLIVCQKSKVNDWVNHFAEHYLWLDDKRCRQIFDLTKPKGFGGFQAAVTFDASSVVGIINYELAWRRKELLKLKDFTLMLDESSLIQNPSAKQSKFIMKLKPKNVILLSRTPVSGKYENLVTQANLLGWKISDDLYLRQYVNRKWIETDGYWKQVIDMDDPYKNVERLKQKMRDHGAVFMKTEEVFDLPQQTFTNVMVDTSKEYRTFVKKHVVTLADGTELIGDQVFKDRLHRRQLCGMYSQAKLEAFKELLQSTNDRVIVFYNYNRELEELEAICNDLVRPYSLINGSNKNLTSYEECEDSVTLIQYQAGAMGLNLQKANKVIYFTLPDKSDLFEQSKARIHRIGQERPCFYWIMMCKGSIEEDIYQTLLMRKDYTDELFVEGEKRK